MQKNQEYVSPTCYTSAVSTFEGIASFIVENLPKSQHVHEIPVDRSVVVFVLEGEGTLTFGQWKDFPVHAGEMVLVPNNTMLSAKVKSDCRFVAWAFSRSLNYVSKYYLENLADALPKDYKYTAHSLPIDPRIAACVHFLTYALDDGFNSVLFQDIKSQELFIYLKRFYPRDTLAKFLSPMLGDDLDFKGTVLDNWQYAQTVENLADICHMSMDNFVRKFKASFGTTPKKWMLGRKAGLIYRDILMSKVPFAEIARKFNFASSAYLTYFCKNHFGITPQEIRDGKFKEEIH